MQVSKNTLLGCLAAILVSVVLATLMYLGGAPKQIIICALILFFAASGLFASYSYSSSFSSRRGP
ncbi:MAG TPA: hypothetical protein VNG29_04545 [Candidatus Paceibacterota bacterium]|nr:hypothetical protein [Candidatus Paceibacterota bacterium]